MPIPHDPLQRWWVETAGENPELVEHLRPALLAFLAFGPGREPRLAGSGFIFAGNTEVALVITAKHVLTEGVGRVQRPRARHAASALFVSSNPPLTIDPKKLRVVWMGTHDAKIMNVGHVRYNDSLDAACCIVTGQDNEQTLFDPITVPLDTAVPELGELVHMISLDGMEVSEKAPPSDPLGTGHELEIGRRVSIRSGVVTGVYPAGLRHYHWPCFCTSIPARPGMSGGFVFLPREGKTISACGVVCADNSTEEAQLSFLQCGESIIGCTWPILGLHMPESIPSGAEKPMQTLYQMMREGRVPGPIDGLEHIEVVEQNADHVVRLRPRLPV
jgi:hypothetical protein